MSLARIWTQWKEPKPFQAIKSALGLCRSDKEDHPEEFGKEWWRIPVEEQRELNDTFRRSALSDNFRMSARLRRYYPDDFRITVMEKIRAFDGFPADNSTHSQGFITDTFGRPRFGPTCIFFSVDGFRSKDDKPPQIRVLLRHEL